MTNPFESLFSRKTMSHAAFERTLRGFEEVRSASGSSQFGCLKRGHCEGEVLVREGVKGSRRQTAAAASDLMRYLKREGQRFDPEKVRKALGALKAVRGMKDIDLTFLANDLHGLMNPEVFASEFVQVRTWVREESNRAREAANDLIDAVSRPGSIDAPSNAKEREQATKALAIEKGKRFADSCLSGPGQKHRQETERLIRWLSPELGASDLSRGIGVNALDHMVEHIEDKLRDQKTALKALLAQANTRGQEPGFHQELKQLSEKYMYSQAVYIKTLAYVANVLGVKRDPVLLPPAFRRPTSEFAQSLVFLANALQAPGSDFMEDNHWAAETKAEAEKRLAELNASNTPVAAQDMHRLQVDQLKADAMKAYSGFEKACLLPKEGATSLNEGQARLRDAMTQALRTTSATERLPLGAVRTNLFGHLPDRIRQLHANLSAYVWASQQSGEKNAVQLKRIRDAARELDEQIDGYLAQLDAVSGILLTDPRIDSLTEELETARDDAGHRIQQLSVLQRDPNGELMRIQTLARQNKSKAEDELILLGMTPVSKVRGAPPRPLDSEPAHMDEVFFNAEVDAMQAELMDLHAALFHPEAPEARRLPTQAIRASRRVGADVGEPGEGVRRSGFRADWDLGHAGLDHHQLVAQSDTRWSVELERTLSGIDETVKNLNRTQEVPPPSTSVPRRSRLVRQNASADLTKQRPTGPVPSQGAKKSPDDMPMSDTAVALERAGRAADVSWLRFVDKCLTPRDGLSGLSQEQRLVTEWWRATSPKDSDLSRVEPRELANVLLKDWPKHLEQIRQALQQLINQRRGQPDAQLESRIERTAQELEHRLDHYFAQLEVVGQRLAHAPAFPNVPASFGVAAREAGENLVSLSKLLRTPGSPLSGAYRLARQARVEASDRMVSAG